MCAAGLAGSTADDVSKEVAIFRAHKATPIVVADDGDVRYPAAATISVPPVDPAVGFVLSTMVGHLFGYEAALAIDASALPLREAREVIDTRCRATLGPTPMLAEVRAGIGRFADEYVDGLRNDALRRPPRGEHGGAPGRPAARRAVRPPGRAVPGRDRARSARRRRSSTTCSPR